MAKEKLKLGDLQVQSFVTALDDEQMHRIKGGYSIKGRRYSYRARWTVVDIRSDVAAEMSSNTTVEGG